MELIKDLTVYRTRRGDTRSVIGAVRVSSSPLVGAPFTLDPDKVWTLEGEHYRRADGRICLCRQVTREPFVLESYYPDEPHPDDLIEAVEPIVGGFGWYRPASQDPAHLRAAEARGRI